MTSEIDTVTGRISTFIVQQQGEGSTMDDVLIVFSRMSEHDFQALIDKLQRIPGVLKLDAKGRTERRVR
jgi:putative Mg2+ transporter-C (MgtC) family protein